MAVSTSKKAVRKKGTPELTEEQQEKAAEIAKAIAVVKEHKRTHRLDHFKPYPWQKKFYSAGNQNKQRLLMAANRVGKTASMAVEVAYHLTGEYPEWWNGIRFKKPTSIWCLGVSGEQLRDVVVKELFGAYLGDGKFDGNGLIRQDQVYQVTPAMGTPRLPRDVAVRYATGNTSLVSFKSYTQGQHVLMGSSQDFIWIDEEPVDPTIYPQCLTRTATGNGGEGGYVTMTFTPENGVTELVAQFMDNRQQGQHLANATWDDAKHLNKETKEQLLNRPYVSTMADTTRGQGETVTKVDDVEVDATMHGGQDHMVRPGNMQEGSLWASADGAVSGIMNAARQASDLPGAEGKPLFMGYGMAGTSPMFATFTGDVALPVAQARMSPAAKKALDKRIREGSGKVTGVKDWPGIDSPNVYEFMLGAGGKRKKVLDALDEFRGEGALNSSQVRTIVTDPRQLNPQVGALMNVGEIDLNRTPFPSLHPTYNTSVPGTPLGQFGSGFNVLDAKPYNRSGQVFTEEMQTRGHDLSADKLPAQVGKAMQGGLIGVLDEDVINDLVTRGIVKP